MTDRESTVSTSLALLNQKAGAQYPVTRPLVPITIGVVSGLWLNQVLAVPGEAVFLGGLALQAFFAAALYRKLHSVAGLLLPVIGLTLGFCLPITTSSATLSGLKEGPQVLTGSVTTRQTVAPGVDKIIMAVEQEVNRGRNQMKVIQVWCYNDLGSTLIPGDLITVRVKVKACEPSSQGIRWQQLGNYSASLTKRVQILEIKRTGSRRWAATRQAILTRITRSWENSLSPESYGLFKALVLGDRYQVSEAMQRAFRDCGLSHLLAISGLHFGIIVVLLERLVQRLFLDRRHRYLTLLGVVLVYTSLLSSWPSVIRASIMVCLMFGAPVVGRINDWRNATAVAALAMLIMQPQALFNVGFQLSFVSVLGIIMLYQPILLQLQRLPFKMIRTVIAVSLSAQLAVFPLTAYYFQQITPFSFLAYLLIAPVFTVTLFSGIVGLLFGCLPPDLMADWLWRVVDFCGHALYWLIQRLAGLDVFSFTYGTPQLWSIACYYGAILLLTLTRRFRFVRYLQAMLIIGMAILEVSAELRANWLHGPLTVTFIDVANGDSALLRFPHGEVMIVDGGGSPQDSNKYLKEVLNRELKRRRIRFVDYLVMTHPHADHAQGLLRILEDYRVGEVWYPHGKGYFRDQLYELSKLKGIRQRIIGNELHKSLKLDDNNRSLVLKLQYGRFRCLLTGDIEATIEPRYLVYGRNLSSQVLKVAHHGSNSSSSPQFLSRVMPELAIVSVGKRNNFGHPAQEVLERILALSQRPTILRTDRVGSITVCTDGVTMEYVAARM